MTDAAPLVLDLLNYIEHVEKLKMKPAFNVPSEFFSASQDDLKGLPEVRFNVQDEDGDVWFRIPRLHEIQAPLPDSDLLDWVTLPKVPTRLPELRPVREVYTDKRLLRTERIEDFPGITELFTWYVENQWKPWATAESLRRQTIKRYNELFSI